MSQLLNSITVEERKLYRQPGSTATHRVYATYRPSQRIGHYVYIAGHAYLDRKAYTDVVIINVHTNRWRSVTSPGPCGTAGECFIHGDTMVWFGRSNAKGKRTERMNLSRFDLVLEEWSDCPATGPVPSQRFAFASGLLESQKLFLVFGGQQMAGQIVNDLHLLDIRTNAWSKPVVKGEPPAPRFRHGTCVHRGVFFCYGGVTTRSRRFSDGIYVLHIARRSNSNTATWSKPKIVRSGQGLFELSSFVLVPFQGMLLFCGGLGTGSGQLRAYDPKTGKLTDLHPVVMGDISDYGYGISAAPLEKEGVIGLFGRRGRTESYLRISLAE